MSVVAKFELDPNPSEHELAEVAALIEKRSGILFDQSRERFFSTRVREHLESKKLQRGSDLVRAVKASNVEYESLLERLLTQETSFFRYPHVFHAMETKDNVMRMRQLKDGVAIAAGETVKLEPGNLHLMFQKVKTPFKQGDTVPVTLIFEKAGKVDLVLQVLSAQGK